MKTILCVEDEREILENNCKFFQGQGYHVLAAMNLAQAREHLRLHAPDAIILDLMLPDGNGLELLKELRDDGNKIPVLILTAWGDPSDVAQGLSMGANDYVSKPFTYEVLQARVETMFRNIRQLPDVLEKGLLELKIRPMILQFGDTRVKLPPIEFFLLQFFMENEGQLVKAEKLYEVVWDAPMLENDSSIKNAISRLRKKLLGSGFDITVERNTGYRFERE
ncbi:MAG: response regulator transcription factor [Coriobacteriaceae bacterium]|jgi:DNA-binding response OmpR family regulator|nr:response regulator transcription factor [Coriobacteriaceae bacterium]